MAVWLAPVRLVPDGQPAPTPPTGKFADFLARFECRLGREAMARWALEARSDWKSLEALGTQNPAEAFQMRLAWSSFVERYTWEGLKREKKDEEARTQALSGDAALITFLDYWTKRIQYLQQKQPGRWKIPDLASDEVREDLREAILTALLKSDFRKHEKIACEATFRLLVGRRDQLRARRRITLVQELALTTRDLAPSPEEIVIEKDRTLKIRDLLAGARMTRAQRSWLESLANAIEQSELRGKENTSFADVARERQQNRAAASRMVHRVQKTLRGRLLVELLDLQRDK